MIICVGATKGGVGKSTLAVNLVVAASKGEGLGPPPDILLVDGDEQGTAMTFTELRAERFNGQPGYTAVALQGAAIRTQVRQMQHKYDHIIIDVGGRDTASLRAALLVSELVIIPTQPRTFDVWAVEQMAELVEEARGFNENLRALLVLNQADSQGQDNADALAALGGFPNMELHPIAIGRRKAIPNAASLGLTPAESRPIDEKAVSELTDLRLAIFGTVTAAR